MLVIYLKRAYHNQTLRQFAFNFGRFNKSANKRYLTVSIKALRKMHRYDTGVTTYLINTDRGLMTGTQAINYNIGGHLMFRLS
jgi:ribosomal protein S8